MSKGRGGVAAGAVLAAALVAPAAAWAQAPPGARPAAFAAPAAVPAGERAEVSGRVAPGTPGVPVAIERLEGGAWAPVARTTTGPRGAFAARVRMPRPGNLRAVVVAADGTVAVSRRRFVGVRRRVSLRVTAAPMENISGRPFTARGAVVPSRRGERFVLEGSVDGGPFRAIRRVTAPAGRVRTTFTPPTGGRWRFRLVAAPRPGADSGGRATTAPMDVFGANPHGVPRDADRYLVQAISEFRLYYYEHGRLRRVFPVVFGAPSTPTPLGSYRVYAKTGPPSAAFGPKVLWYHRGYGIHGTNQEYLLQHRVRYYSHGCTRNYNVNILWLWDRVPVGTPVRNIA
ncbi:L,D-transpeptidase [Miltoncostaea marina]|uniref:L,D-transpeptidase n=1 Tax=Miltoncostaea marina TaxID=2843215 RepID=UPI001C3E5F85|nr:L,D-transpeptidase [Miltoncostaea marina]